MPKINFNNAEFIKSAVDPSGFISDGLPQIVFAGRSNVGKSSLLNRLTRRTKLARVSGEPGKTIHVNYFLIDKQFYFVDLPGYGYARRSQAERERWGVLIEAYFHNNPALRLGVQIVDHRHKPTDDDIIMSDFFRGSGIPFLVAANKADKLKKSEVAPALELISHTLRLSEDDRLCPCSCGNGNGIAEIEEIITSALDEGGDDNAAS